jgi:hypothetical protein
MNSKTTPAEGIVRLKSLNVNHRIGLQHLLCLRQSDGCRSRCGLVRLLSYYRTDVVRPMSHVVTYES